MSGKKKQAKPVRPKPKIGPSTDKKSNDGGVRPHRIRPPEKRQK